MIFIWNIMEYKCHDELIIVLLFTRMKGVAWGQSATHPGLPLFFFFYVRLGHARGQTRPSGH